MLRVYPKTYRAYWGYIGIVEKKMETAIIELRVILGLYSRPSNVIPFWVCYGFLVRILVRTTKKVLHWGLGKD